MSSQDKSWTSHAFELVYNTPLILALMSTRARASRIALPFRFTVYETVTSGGPSAYLTFEHLRGGEAPSRYSIYLDDQGLKSLIETLCDYSVQAQRDKEIA